ncbi:hypothetical protein [uncultured Roseibium sp.]|uniref:hypothetical protein n=1 Tax=uncultured Roseibium sp. TaxID=1936171 RepID=UPI00260D7D19|nr:hypothetical protein [uncultured Roseibium sp.]
MSANKTSQSYIEQSLEETRAKREIATERLVRLFHETFEDGDRAVRAYGQQVGKRGIEYVVRKVQQDDGFFNRHWHFGWMRGGLFAEGNRKKALEHLQQLPDAMRTHHNLVTEEWDLVYALERVRERDAVKPDREVNRGRWEPERERER